MFASCVEVELIVSTRLSKSSKLVEPSSTASVELSSFDVYVVTRRAASDLCETFRFARASKPEGLAEVTRSASRDDVHVERRQLDARSAARLDELRRFAQPRRDDQLDFDAGREHRPSGSLVQAGNPAARARAPRRTCATAADRCAEGRAASAHRVAAGC